MANSSAPSHTLRSYHPAVATTSLGPARLPAEVSERLLAEADAIARRMTRRLADDIPLPGEFRRVPYLRMVMRACRDALRALLRQLHDGRRAHPAELAALSVAGSQQAELGVPLEVLLSGYRLAAKVVWREVLAEAVRLGELEPATAVALSEQVLEYLDDISGAVGSAYLETRERLLRQRDRDRDRVLRRLVEGDISSDLRRLAAAADVPLSPPYRVLAVSAPPHLDVDRLLSIAWREAQPLLVADEPGVWVALVGAGADVGALASRARAAIGAGDQPDAPQLVVGSGPVAATLEEVAGAAQHARDALLIGRRLNPDAAVHDDRDLSVFAGLNARPTELRRFVEHALGPLLDSAARRTELLETLETVLATRGHAEAAAELGVHRHTVVYRLGRIGALLGVDLDDPAVRHRLWLAVTLLRLTPDDTAG